MLVLKKYLFKPLDGVCRFYCNVGNSEPNLDKCFQRICELCKQGGEIMLEPQKYKSKYLTKQSVRDIVTEQDKLIENLIINGLRKHFPDHKFIGEESFGNSTRGFQLTDEPTWIIDPIDGTMNFVHGFPFFCTSVALFVGKVNELGVIYNPLLDQWYTARRGQGAKLNGETIRVSGIKELSKSLIIHELGRKLMPEFLHATFSNVETFLPLVHGVRGCGSTALNLALVAQGAVESYYNFGQNVWDIAAGELIVREAGGIVLDPCGGQLDLMARRVLAAASEELACSIGKLLTQVFPRPRDDELSREENNISKPFLYNNKQATVSEQPSFRKCTFKCENLDQLDLGGSLFRNTDRALKQGRTGRMRSQGSVVLNMCKVAQGTWDAYYAFGSHAWDIATASLLIREPGGVILDSYGGELDIKSGRVVCAATPELVEQLIAILIQMVPQPTEDEAVKCVT